MEWSGPGCADSSCDCRYDRVEPPSYPDSEITHYPVHPDTTRQKARRHTHHSGIMAASIRPEQGRLWDLETDDEIFIRTNSNDFNAECAGGAGPAEEEKEKVGKVEEDEKPSFRTLQSEDHRRPSVTVYQMEDSDHPDVKSIQQIVSNMTFCDPWSDRLMISPVSED